MVFILYTIKFIEMDFIGKGCFKANCISMELKKSYFISPKANIKLKDSLEHPQQTKSLETFESNKVSYPVVLSTYIRSYLWQHGTRRKYLVVMMKKWTSLNRFTLNLLKFLTKPNLKQSYLHHSEENWKINFDFDFEIFPLK